MLSRKSAFLLTAVLLLSSSWAQEEENLDRYLHPQAKLGPDLPSPIFDESGPKPITPRQAAAYALGHLKRRRVVHPVICEARWIAAPFGGYLVDALGSLKDDGVEYSVFRVGVYDGLDEWEGRYKTGEEFVFIALGRDASGAVVWYPPPGPDHQLSEDEAFDMMLPYEFLLWREEFETLPERYPLMSGDRRDGGIHRAGLSS